MGKVHHRQIHLSVNNHEPISKVLVASAAMYSSYYNLLRVFRASSGFELESMREDFISWLQSYHMPVYGLADAVDKWRSAAVSGDNASL